MPRSGKKAERITVGWREMVSLPDWEINSLRAKIDTGARTSAIDVDQIERVSDQEVRFDVVMSNHHRRMRKWITAEITRETIVKSSNGVRETRYVVSTPLTLGGVTRMAEFTLVRRANMLCRMLIGRTALRNRYLVDVSRTYLASPDRIIKRRKKTS